MRQYTYILILFFTVIVCFIASFDKRIKFDQYFLPFLKAAIIVAIPFISWDIWFTLKGIWWFNFDYTLGIQLFGLPIEEWLFFISIPFACVFTYYCMNNFFRWEHLIGFNNILVFTSIIVCSVIALLHPHQTYTLVTAISTTVTLIFLHFIVRATWISKASLTYLILMLGFLPVNGILTGTGIDHPVVNYNSKTFLDIRILTIPIEDAVYGYTQFLLVIYFFYQFRKKRDQKLPLK
ncbi:lycopene cyclase domain-containing protein [Rhizosphaericola mali]|uniref:Lycopene cyclase domain-containing protein n=1 Tax=Rhizosphaericola mali TaxID=2545455 RepID=A0A5P2G3C9_9BACT|nr:lycopene cyclase domain-containing protein [Rhizosphaericola mali]QES88310.1 lycopene cyclase domain-containing protein [Rhizosphaericola mali]